MTTPSPTTAAQRPAEGAPIQVDRDLANLVLQQVEAVEEARANIHTTTTTSRSEVPQHVLQAIIRSIADNPPLADDLSDDDEDESSASTDLDDIEEPIHETSQKVSEAHNKTVQECYRALMSVQYNAGLKQRKLELELVYVRKQLSDANAKIGKLVALTRSMKSLVQAATDKPEVKLLADRELEHEREITRMTNAYKKVTEENYLLKKLLVQGCDQCRARLSVRANPARNPQVMNAVNSLKRTPIAKSPRPKKRRPTYQSAANKIVDEMSPSRSQGAFVATTLPAAPMTPVKSDMVHRLPPVPVRGILKSNSAHSARSMASAASPTTVTTAASTAATASSALTASRVPSLKSVYVDKSKEEETPNQSSLNSFGSSNSSLTDASTQFNKQYGHMTPNYQIQSDSLRQMGGSWHASDRRQSQKSYPVEGPYGEIATFMQRPASERAMTPPPLSDRAASSNSLQQQQTELAPEIPDAEPPKEPTTPTRKLGSLMKRQRPPGPPGGEVTTDAKPLKINKKTAAKEVSEADPDEGGGSADESSPGRKAWRKRVFKGWKGNKQSQQRQDSENE